MGIVSIRHEESSLQSTATLEQQREKKERAFESISGNEGRIAQDFEKSLWFRRERVHVVAPKEASTCRSKGPKGEWIERTYAYVIAKKQSQGKNLTDEGCGSL